MGEAVNYQEKDEQLFSEIAKYNAGQSTNQQLIYELSYNYVYKTINDIVNDAAATEVIIKPVYEQIYNNLSALSEPAVFHMWAGRIASNNALAFIKSQRDLDISGGDKSEENAALEADITATVYDDKELLIPESFLQDRERQQLIVDMIDKLPVEQKLCVQFYYYEAMSVQEIAELIGCTESDVKRQLSHVKKALKDIIADSDTKKVGRVFSLAELPLLWLLFKEACEQMADLGAKAAWEEISRSIVTANETVPVESLESTKPVFDVAAKTLTKEAAKAAGVKLGSGIGAKIAIAIGAVTFALGGVATINNIVTDDTTRIALEEAEAQAQAEAEAAEREAMASDELFFDGDTTDVTVYTDGMVEGVAKVETTQENVEGNSASTVGLAADTDNETDATADDSQGYYDTIAVPACSKSPGTPWYAVIVTFITPEGYFMDEVYTMDQYYAVSKPVSKWKGAQCEAVHNWNGQGYTPSETVVTDGDGWVEFDTDCEYRFSYN